VSRILAIAWGIVAVVSTGAATAQEPADESEGAAAEPVVIPPELIDYVQAEYPTEAFAAGLEAVVVAEIDIDENGLVTAVRIVETAGSGFDEAAAAAMAAFVFAPATRDGEPIPSRVVYRYTFFIEEQAEQTEVEPLPAALSGQVTDLNGLAIAEATVALVTLEAADDAKAPDAGGADEPAGPIAVADAEGRFALPDLAAGSYQVDVVAAGYKPFSTTEQLGEGEELEVIYRLETETALYETVVRGRRPPREVTRREVTRREITRIPGTGGDALRSIQNLPGMARAPIISGALIVRGSSPGDSSVYFDSIPMPLLYHFGGLTSVINSDLLERIDFYPGNYSVRYGRATGGIVDVYPRQPKTDRFHAYVDADIWDIGALVETPIGDSWSVAAAARRSYIDGILNAVLPDDGGFAFTTAPRYWDYQVIADYHPDQRDNLRLFVYGSDDEMVFVLGDELGDNPNLGGGVDVGLAFHKLQARWQHRFSKEVSNQINFGCGYQHNHGTLGEYIEFRQRDVPLHLRDELVLDPGRIFILRAGLDGVVGWTDFRFRAPEDFPQEGEQFDPLGANTGYVEEDDSLWYYRPGLYTELELTAIPRTRLIMGLRADYIARLQQVDLDPRFVARYRLFEGTTLKGGIGLFHQSPDGAMTNDEYGNPDLESITAIHYGLGVEQQIIENVEAGLEGFYKDVGNLPVTTDAMVERDGELVPERYRSNGVGRIYGLELLLKHYPTDRFFGWIAYTLMKSERIDRPGEQPRPFDFDQTHILTLVASAVIGHGWEAGVRFRLSSGNPVTPVIGSIYDADSDIYWPVYGETNSDRLPMFHQLDVRVDKNFLIANTIKAAIYVDVQNVYNHKNPETYRYNYDFSKRVYFYGLPILPSVGIKLEY
jgi:TonB family protein